MTAALPRRGRIVLGAMNFGTTVADDTAFALLDAYVDAGGAWIDTANCYAFWNDPSGVGGQSEELIGRWLAARPGVRDRVRRAGSGRPTTRRGGSSGPAPSRGTRASRGGRRSSCAAPTWSPGPERRCRMRGTA